MKVTFKIFMFLIIFSSCKTVENKFSRTKLLKLSDSEIRLKNQKILIDKVYLDEKNIKNVSVDKKLKIVNIEQTNKKPNFENLDNICRKAVSEIDYEKIDLAVINGEPIKKTDFNSIKIETTAIRKINILKDAESGILRCNSNGYILIIQISSN